MLAKADVDTTDRVLELVRRLGVARPRDLAAAGLPRHALARLVRQGALVRLRRGLYALPDTPPTQYQTLVEVAKWVPHGVVALLSALQFHELTSHLPHRVWLAIGPKDRTPRADLPLRVVRFSGPALTEGIETHELGGVQVRVYSPAKTVVDCFKFRNKIGLDIAIEALQICLHDRRCTRADLWRYAEIDRVTNVIRPYLEALP